MGNHYIKFIYCNELQIAASCEDRVGDVMSTYLPSTILFFTQLGTLHLKIGNEEFLIPKNNFGLIRKHHTVQLRKTWSTEEKFAKTYGFVLTNDFIKKVIDHIELPKSISNTNLCFLDVPNTDQLQEIMDSLIQHIDNGENLNTSYVEQQTQKALQALILANKDIGIIFKEFSQNEKADLEELILNNYLYNLPLKVLAEQSGRSLSTFNRDFKVIFNETPHKWILNKRLEHAKHLMEHDHVKPSEVFLQCGFEDLSHFSRTFKKKFEIPPSVFYKNCFQES